MHDEFDKLIDDAVRSYASAEPSPELAISILRRAQQVSATRRPRLALALAVALPVAATAAIMAVVSSGPMAMPPAPPAVATIPAAPKVQPSPVLAEAAPRRVSARTHVPKDEAALATLWPLPIKYSKQERALLSLVQQHPKEAAAIAAAQKQEMQPLAQQPITISRLTIAPLTSSVLKPEE